MGERVQELINVLSEGTDKAQCIEALTGVSAVTLQWCKCCDFQSIQALSFIRAIGSAVAKFWNDPVFAAEFAKFFGFFFGSQFAEKVSEGLQVVAEAVVANVEDDYLTFYAPMLEAYLEGPRFRHEGEDDVLFRYFRATVSSEKKKGLCKRVLTCLVGAFGNFSQEIQASLLKRCVELLPDVTAESRDVAFEFITCIIWHICEMKAEGQWLLFLEDVNGAETFEKLVDFLAENWTDRNVANFTTVCQTPMLSFLAALVIERHEKLALKVLDVVAAVIYVLGLYFNAEDKEPFVKAMGRVGDAVFEKVRENRDAVIAKWFAVVGHLLKLMPNEEDENNVLFLGAGIFTNMVDSKLVAEHFEYLERILEHCENGSTTANDIMSKILDTVPIDTVANTVTNVESFKQRVVKTCLSSIGHNWKILVAKMNLTGATLEEVVRGLLVNQDNLKLLLTYAESTERIEITLMLALEMFDPHVDDNAMVLAKLFSSAFQFANGLLEEENFRKILNWFKDCSEKVIGTLLLLPQVFECPTSCGQAVAVLDNHILSEAGREAVARFTYARLVNKAEAERTDISNIDFTQWTRVFHPTFEQILLFLMHNKNNRSLYVIAHEIIDNTVVDDNDRPTLSEHVSSLFSIPEKDSFELLLQLIDHHWNFGEQTRAVFLHCMNHSGNRDAWKCAISLLFGEVVDPYADAIDPPSFKCMNLVPDLLIAMSICLSRTSHHENLAKFCVYVMDNLCEGNYVTLGKEFLPSLCALFGFMGDVDAGELGIPAMSYKRASSLTFSPIFPFEDKPKLVQLESSKTADAMNFSTFVNNQADAMGKRDEESQIFLCDVSKLFVTLLLNTYSTTPKDKQGAVLTYLYVLLVSNPFLTRQEDKDCVALYILEEISARLLSPAQCDSPDLQSLAMAVVYFCCDRLIADSWFRNRYGVVIGRLISISKQCKCKNLPECVRTAFASAMLRLVRSVSQERKAILFAAFLGENDTKEELLWLWEGARYDNLVCILFAANGFIHNDDSLFQQGSIVMTKILGMWTDKAFKIDIPKNRAPMKAAIAQWQKISFQPDKGEIGSFSGTDAGKLYQEIADGVRNKQADFPPSANVAKLCSEVIQGITSFTTAMQSTFANIELEESNQVALRQTASVYSDGLFFALRDKQRIFKGTPQAIPQETGELRKAVFMTVYDIPSSSKNRHVELTVFTWTIPSVFFAWGENCAIAVGFDSNFHPEAADEVTPWLSETLTNLSLFESRPVLQIPISSVTTTTPTSANIVLPGIEDQIKVTSERPFFDTLRS